VFLHKTNFLMRAAYPRLRWRVPVRDKTVYLTFDDGPIPGVTEFVLDQLARFGAKGTFFCIGDNVRKHPGVLRQIIEAGHGVGNHTFHHRNGWHTPEAEYLANVRACQDVLPAGTRLFRPPYGRITRAQIRALLPDYEIIMWDVLTGDFSAQLSPERVLQKTLRYTEPGSIVVFHDSVKAFRVLEYALPRTLEALTERGVPTGRLAEFEV
jgi:peptidoglycan/xylan/chitin deacetylase (PgdA/CDA1 family)